jgi:hypothetical protein
MPAQFEAEDDRQQHAINAGLGEVLQLDWQLQESTVS